MVFNYIKELYSCYISKPSSFSSKFEHIFSLPYKFVFGDLSYDEVILNLLCLYYRNELFVKRALEASPYLNSSFIEELPLLDSRVDIASVNGYSYAFEIKTQYDTLSRLEKQINDYSKCFEKIYIVCSSDKYEQVMDIVPEYCGILTYSNKGRCVFTKKRSPKVSPKIDPKSQLDFLYKKELKKTFNMVETDKIIKSFDSKKINITFKLSVENRIKKK